MNAQEDRFGAFEDILTSMAEVREIIGQPKQRNRDQAIDHLDEICRDFIAQSPFALLASCGPGGRFDVSPKGDPVGFVQVLDDKHLAIPDRRGNKRADTFENLFENPYVGLIFIVPGKNETLRVNGEARIVRDTKLRESMAVDGKVPDLAVVVYVERALYHCPKCMLRSKLWEPDAWPDSSDLPILREALIKHAELNMTPEELREQGIKDGLHLLY